jgi:sulfite reductase alpha subunit-like flavoprotein
VFASELKRRGIRAKCLAMDDFDFDDLPNQSKVFAVVATCGQGEFPANCKEFWKQLNDPSLPADFLANTKVAMFGLGDSSYVFFNEAAKSFQDRFRDLGAATIMDMGMGDDKDEDKWETKWNEWIPDLWNELGTAPPAQELLPPSYHVKIEPASSLAVPDVIVPTGGLFILIKVIEIENFLYLFAGTKLIPMTKNQLLTPAEYDRDIRHYEFDLKGSGMNYSVGDCLGIYPHNAKELVDEFCTDYDLSPDSILCLEDTQVTMLSVLFISCECLLKHLVLQGRKDPLPGTMTARQLFTEVLDMFGKPSRRFYETLSIAATDPSEKAELEHLLSKEGKDDLKKLTKETVTYADLLKKYPSSKLNLEYILDHVPRIKPRLYSIASSLEMHPDQVQLCIVKDDWTTPSGKYKVGTSTNYLCKLSQGGTPDLVASKMNAAGITIPDTEALPCVMVGLGTGIAPFRAMVEEREVARTRCEPTGPMALFFGARYRATDYTYGDEFEEYHSNGKGVLTHLSLAFSRDQEHKIYVQNRIDEHPEVIYDMLGKKNGYFYLCGPAGNVPPSVRKAVCNAFVKCGGHTPEEADKIVTQMQIEGRYNVEAW